MKLWYWWVGYKDPRFFHNGRLYAIYDHTVHATKKDALGMARFRKRQGISGDFVLKKIEVKNNRDLMKVALGTVSYCSEKDPFRSE